MISHFLSFLTRREEVSWNSDVPLLKQGNHWSTGIISISGILLGSGLLWLFIGRLDQTVSAKGKLVVANPSIEVRAPIGGQLTFVKVSEGEFVESGQRLIDIGSESAVTRYKILLQLERDLNTELAGLRWLSSKGRNNSAGREISTQGLLASNLPTDLTSTAGNIYNQLHQIDNRLQSKRRNLALQQDIAKSLGRIYLTGAIARNSYLQQLDTVETLEGEVRNLQIEKSRLYSQAEQEYYDAMRKYATAKTELIEVKDQLKLRSITAPSSGIVFNKKVAYGMNVSAGERLFTIIPKGSLAASVDVSNSDIGFIKPGMDVSVSVDSFPAGEFGYIKGIVRGIGGDSLQSAISPALNYFPVSIRLLKQQAWNGNKQMNLQSGMGVVANIKIRSRPAVTVITDIFTRQIEGIKRFR